MAVVAHTESDVALLARLMRAEAESDGKLGMLMVGNTGINRVIAACLDFTDIRNINDMVFQSPGGFEATQKGYFYQRARESDKRLARRAIQGERQHPATNSIWFFFQEGACPANCFNHLICERFKLHFFYIPTKLTCYINY